MIIWFIEMINKTDGYDILVFFHKIIDMAMKYHWQIMIRLLRWLVLNWAFLHELWYFSHYNLLFLWSPDFFMTVIILNNLSQ